MLEFKTLWRDTDDMLALQVTVQGGGHAATHEAYVYPQHLDEFGAALKAFPFGGAREAVLESGAEDPKFYGHMKLRVFLLSGFGRSALEMQHEIRGEPPHRASATFYILGEPASFNRLGEDICQFVASNSQTMRTEWRDP